MKKLFFLFVIFFISVSCKNEQTKDFEIVYTANFSSIEKKNISKISELINNLSSSNKEDLLLIDSGGFFDDTRNINTFNDILQFYNNLQYTCIAPSFFDITTETFISILNSIKAPKILTNIELSEKFDTSQFHKSIILEKSGLRFLIMNIVDNSKNAVSKTVKKNIPNDIAIKIELLKNQNNYDFIILSTNLEFSKLPNICFQFPEIHLILWSDGFFDLPLPKKNWNDILIVSSNISDNIGRLILSFNYSEFFNKYSPENFRYKNQLISVKNKL
ncbi:MAG TPA: hypothetical protein PLM75_10870 [bacterium]|nr:hypothetical protein [bacterium]